MCSINIPITRRSINAFLGKPFLKKDLVLFLTSKLINGKHFVQTGDLIYHQILNAVGYIDGVGRKHVGR